MEGINIVFKNKEGDIKKLHFSNKEIFERMQDDAYDQLTEPDCCASTCQINGFCECNPINEDFEYSTLESVN